MLRRWRAPARPWHGQTAHSPSMRSDTAATGGDARPERCGFGYGPPTSCATAAPACSTVEPASGLTGATAWPTERAVAETASATGASGAAGATGAAGDAGEA